MRAQQPFLYAAADLHDSRFPQNTFDPKAITRTSYASELPRPKKQNGPLVSFNRHPEYVSLIAFSNLTEVLDLDISTY